MRALRSLQFLGTLLASPAFQFGFSAVVLGIGGGWIAAYQQCRIQADEIGLRYQRIGAELVYRRQQYALAMALSQNVDDLTRRLAAIPQYQFLEFRDRTAADLVGERIRLRRRIDDEDFRQDSIKAVSDIPVRIERDLFQLADLWGGRVPQTLRDEDMPFVHEFAERLFKMASADSGVIQGYTSQANCSGPVLVRSLLGDESAKTAAIVSILPRRDR